MNITAYSVLKQAASKSFGLKTGGFHGRVNLLDHARSGCSEYCIGSDLPGSRNCGRSTADHQRRQAYLRQIPHPVLRTKEKKGAVLVHRLGIST